MQRFRIAVASILAFVALSALDCFTFKWSYSRIATSLNAASSNSIEAYFEGMLSAGLIPAGNAAAVAIYLAVHRRRTARPGRGDGASARAALAFALCAASGMLLVVTLWATAPKCLLAYFGVVSRPCMRLIRWSGLIRVATDVEKPLLRFVIDPLFMALTLSGPPMLLAWIAGSIAGKCGPATLSAAFEEPGDAKAPRLTSRECAAERLPAGNGKCKPRPLEDEANVDQRRKAVALEPLADDSKQAESFYDGWKTCANRRGDCGIRPNSWQSILTFGARPW